MRRNLFLDNPQPTMPVSSIPPILNSASNPPYQEVSDEFWSQSHELLDKVMTNSSLTVTRVSAGSPIEASQSQSPGLFEAPTHAPLHLETAPVLAMSPVVGNHTPKMLSEPIGPLDFSKGGTGNKYRALLILKYISYS